MNEKFEKLFNDSVWHSEQAKAAFGDGYLAAIQSLEVTPDIVNVATAAYNDEIDICDEANVDYVDGTYMRIALLAVLSALKEQAK